MTVWPYCCQLRQILKREYSLWCTKLSHNYRFSKWKCIFYIDMHGKKSECDIQIREFFPYLYLLPLKNLIRNSLLFLFFTSFTRYLARIGAEYGRADRGTLLKIASFCMQTSMYWHVPFPKVRFTYEQRMPPFLHRWQVPSWYMYRLPLI